LKKLIVLLMLGGFVILSGLPGHAAPIRPIGPVDVTGTISEVQWVPEKTVKGIPRMSGSAGRDRVMSPYFLVRLVDYEGVAPEMAVTMTRYLDWSAFQNQEVRPAPFHPFNNRLWRSKLLKKGDAD
jgi:hypothetical protein